MKKIILLLLIIIAGIGLVVFLTSNNSKDQATTVIQNKTEELPDRPAEINGVIRSVIGNELIIANEIKDQNLTEEEKEAQKLERANLTQEERQALRQEGAIAIETESVTLIIPVGVPVLKASGTGDGSLINAEFVEIKSGSYVSIWMNNDEAEAIKLKGVN